MIHNLGNVDCFELREIPSETQNCPKYWTEGTVYCACGTRLIPKAFTRCLTRERFDALTIPDVVIKKGHDVVLATEKTRHNSSTNKRKIVSEKL